MSSLSHSQLINFGDTRPQEESGVRELAYEEGYTLSVCLGFKRLLGSRTVTTRIGDQDG